MSSLSGGEKSRLSLAKIVLLQANTLILDEPSNHLDIPAREALEQALLSYPGTILIVSHDRYLVNKVAERMLILDGEGRSSLFEGSYAEWESRQARQKPAIPGFPFDRREQPIPEPAGPKKLSKNEWKRTKDRCERLELEIKEVETRIEALVAKMNDPSIAGDYTQLRDLGQEHQEHAQRRDFLYSEWEHFLLLWESR